MTASHAHLGEVLSSHFDPRWGAPYWIELRKTLRFNPITDITSTDDLLQFPPFPMEALSQRPITHWIPKSFHGALSSFVTAESGGATGAPTCTAYHPDDFQAAFVAPFVAAAGLFRFPRDRHWLFVGPSGPHVIGKAARACAAALGSIDPFTVDFDPRWVRKLPLGSLGRTRYLEHVMEQAMRILSVQDIGVLFSTPPVLEALGERMPRDARERIAGIHLGGMAPPAGFWTRLATFFPNAVTLSGYGNSLAGVCPEVESCVDEAPVYVPHGPRLFVGVTPAEEGERGRIFFHRLDKACFLPHVVEGDEAELVTVNSAAAIAAGFHARGLRDPRPALHHAETRQDGLY